MTETSRLVAARLTDWREEYRGPKPLTACRPLLEEIEAETGIVVLT